MIKMIIDANGIAVTGHSGYAPPGQDIVCAAVSTLVQTLVAALEQLTDTKIYSELRLGRAVIRYRDLSERSKLLIDSFLLGISGVAENYPECVKLCLEERPSLDVVKSNGSQARML